MIDTPTPAWLERQTQLSLDRLLPTAARTLRGCDPGRLAGLRNSTGGTLPHHLRTARADLWRSVRFLLSSGAHPGHGRGDVAGSTGRAEGAGRRPRGRYSLVPVATDARRGVLRGFVRRQPGGHPRQAAVFPGARIDLPAPDAIVQGADARERRRLCRQQLSRSEPGARHDGRAVGAGGRVAAAGHQPGARFRLQPHVR